MSRIFKYIIKNIQKYNREENKYPLTSYEKRDLVVEF